MSATANYANGPNIGSGTTTTADTSYTAPTTATVGVAYQDVSTASATARSRIDQIDSVCQGTSVAGLLRFWLREGNPGPTISSITSSTTTATMTTATNHNLITGDLFTARGAFPVEYNVTNAAVTVTSATAFTYTIVSTGSVAARDVGAYASCHTAPVYHLLYEVPVVAITGSTTLNAFQHRLNSAMNADVMPIVVPAGWAVCTTVSVTQTNAIKTTCRGGKF